MAVPSLTLLEQPSSPLDLQLDERAVITLASGVVAVLEERWFPCRNRAIEPGQDPKRAASHTARISTWSRHFLDPLLNIVRVFGSGWRNALSNAL